MHDTGFGHGVTGIGDDAQIRLWPGAGKVDGDLRRCHHIVAAMHDHAGNVPQAVRGADQLIVGVEKAAMHEVVAFDARKRERVSVF